MRVSVVSNAYAPKIQAQKPKTQMVNFKRTEPEELQDVFNTKLEKFGNPYPDVKKFEFRHIKKGDPDFAFNDEIVLLVYFIKSARKEPICCGHEDFSLIYNNKEDAINKTKKLLDDVDEFMPVYREEAATKPTFTEYVTPHNGIW